ncbi:MAG: hypothetical protein JXA92_06275 [candidate division Zixibacteria bacterium]|nr:hypothetical protein [candidate division Zixibacteria bacterium]
MFDFSKIKGRRKVYFLTAFLICLVFFTGSARELQPRKKWDDAKIRPWISTADRPLVEYAAHNRGNIQLAIANNGTFGTYGQDIGDPFTGERIPSLVYPKNSDIVYLWVGAFWIGAIVGRDTLVSTGTEDFYDNQEFWPGELFGSDTTHFVYKSIDVNSRFFSEDALSEQDIICEYYDTLTDPSYVNYDRYDQRPHIPLNIKVTQRTMAWSYDYADDFILFDYQIKNIGLERLSQVYMGIWIDGDVWHISRNSEVGWNDDIVGFLRSHPAPEGGSCVDTVNIAYTADNDGDPDGANWDYRSARDVVGVRVVRTPAESLKYSYNWWIINYYDPLKDFGPRRQPTTGDPFRRFSSRLGTPEGDRNKYYILRHEEFDYDLIYTAVDHTTEGWLSPPENAETYARGFDTRYMLSFGPFNIEPGQSLPISLAIVGGTGLHRDPTDFEALFDPHNPDIFYNSLDFSNLALNARWASWIYDNPGVDTDGDDYYGKYRVCDGSPDKKNPTDSIDDGGHWYEGDGVPDFRGAGPPPSPKIRIIPSVGRLVIRWNGYYSENIPDIFLQEIDFEGYRVYVALDDRPSSFTLLRSFDREDYNRFIWKQLPGGDMGWALEEVPFTLDSLKIIYNDPNFDPTRFTPSQPLNYDSTLYYFESQDFNAYDLLSPGGIHKVYPEITVPPPADSSQWTDTDLTYDYDPPLPKYYEYEYVLEDILPTVPYYVSVTAFDFGSPNAGLDALETKPVNNMVIEYPLTPADTVEAKDLDVYVYPNPYRIDGNYYELGFEGRDSEYKIPDRMRRIHFANLPRVCKISIYSLDGDLIREIDHNYPQGGPGSMHDTWDLITRNTQRVVSGIYYYVVESETRTQIGKFVIIL